MIGIFGDTLAGLEAFCSQPRWIVSIWWGTELEQFQPEFAVTSGRSRKSLPEMDVVTASHANANANGESAVPTYSSDLCHMSLQLQPT